MFMWKTSGIRPDVRLRHSLEERRALVDRVDELISYRLTGSMMMVTPLRAAISQMRPAVARKRASAFDRGSPSPMKPRSGPR